MSPRGGLDAWFGRMKPTTLIVVRTLIVANVTLLAVVGGLYAAFAARPAGLVVAGVVWAGACVLVAMLPLTTPRRGNDSRW